MQTLTYRFPADRTPVRHVHVGVSPVVTLRLDQAAGAANGAAGRP